MQDAGKMSAMLLCLLLSVWRQGQCDEQLDCRQGGEAVLGVEQGGEGEEEGGGHLGEEGGEGGEIVTSITRG